MYSKASFDEINDKTLDVRDTPVWEIHLCEGYTCVRDTPVWEIHMCERYTCVRDTPVWEIHLCEGYTCVRDTPVWEIHLCERYLCERYTCVRDTPVWEIHLCERYTCVRDTPVWEIHLCERYTSGVVLLFLHDTHSTLGHSTVTLDKTWWHEIIYWFLTDFLEAGPPPTPWQFPLGVPPALGLVYNYCWMTLVRWDLFICCTLYRQFW